MMRINDIVIHILKSEHDSFSYLKGLGFFIMNSIPCPGKRVAVCNSEMKVKERKMSSMRSMRGTHPFLSYHDARGKAHSNLSILDILRLVNTFTNTPGTNRDKMKLTINARQTFLIGVDYVEEYLGCGWINVTW